MPLMKKASEKAFKHNVKAEMHAGKPQAQSLAIAYATKRRAKKEHMAKGGFVHEEEAEYDPVEHPHVEHNEIAMHEDDKDLNQHHVEEMGMAHGGMAEHEKDADMIARIMHKHKMYSKGGEVSNDVGVSEADKLPAEFDDLVLRDDDLSGADYTEANSGDDDGMNEAGSEAEYDDPIDRVMMKRRKQHNPRPA